MNTSAPLAVFEAEQRVLGWQTKLHRWAVQDEQQRDPDATEPNVTYTSGASPDESHERSSSVSGSGSVVSR